MCALDACAEGFVRKSESGLFVKGECNEEEHKVKGAFEELHVLAPDVDDLTGGYEHTALLGKQEGGGDGHDIYGDLFYCGGIRL